MSHEERLIPEEKSIKSVLEEYTPVVMALPSVVGIGQGEYDGKPCIKVFVARATPELLEQIPPFLGGYRVIVQETGGFRALDRS